MKEQTSRVVYVVIVIVLKIKTAQPDYSPHGINSNII